MPVLRVNDRQHVLQPGATRLGAGATVDIDLGSASALPDGAVQAIVETTDGSAVIRRVGAGSVKVNGVALGAEPTPLMHGDKVEVGGVELIFAEDAKVGTTKMVSRDEIAGLVQKRGASRATTGTGGRVVSLVDGKEYTVPSTGLVIGRDASCTVVVAQNEVSRRHAEIVPSERGYVVHDHSTNGVYVNGVRVPGSQLLARSDVLRIGTEEFRFYADVASSVSAGAADAASSAMSGGSSLNGAAPSGAGERAAAAAPGAPTSPASSTTPSPSASPSASASSVGADSARGAPTPLDGEATVRAPAVADDTVSSSSSLASRPLLATLDTAPDSPGGARRIDVRLPLVHVGRGLHNEVVLDDDSVSDTHAKLQLRDDGWYLVDLGSTNGTFVGSSRIVNERRLDSAAALRFGGVKLAFEPVQSSVGRSGTRAMATTGTARGKSEPRTAPISRTPLAAPQQGRRSVWLWIFVLVAAAAAFYLLKSR